MNRIARALLWSGVLLISACGGGGGGSPASSTPPVVTPVSTELDVTPCLTQTVNGRTVASLVVPDVLTLDLNQPGGFPNGRRLDDPVIDLELAALFLDLSKVPVTVLANLPLDPGGPDRVGNGSFPYIADAHGGVPASTGGAGFVFRTDAPSAYTRVDRMGEPAVATVLVRSPMKTAFNDDSPAGDANGKYVTEFTADLTEFATALKDDWAARGLPICAVPK